MTETDFYRLDDFSRQRLNDIARGDETPEERYAIIRDLLEKQRQAMRVTSDQFPIVSND